ncbi:MAG: hypothetical protein JST87_01420 [Bacteroidetes bacterium]|nr:hypothetical protein [Bacteroidota bacterium]
MSRLEDKIISWGTFFTGIAALIVAILTLIDHQTVDKLQNVVEAQIKTDSSINAQLIIQNNIDHELSNILWSANLQTVQSNSDKKIQLDELIKLLNLAGQLEPVTYIGMIYDSARKDAYFYRSVSVINACMTVPLFEENDSLRLFAETVRDEGNNMLQSLRGPFTTTMTLRDSITNDSITTIETGFHAPGETWQGIIIMLKNYYSDFKKFFFALKDFTDSLQIQKNNKLNK